ncbi:MAG: allantoicase [Luteolibacter sp.]
MSIPLHDPEAPDFTRRFLNLADARLGAVALEASDDFFADKSRMLNPEPAIFIPGKYDTNGKWMDGWESRRKRTAGHDWCVVELARPGTIHGLEIDTSHFIGNFPPAASLEALTRTGEWIGLLPAKPLQGNSHHYFTVENAEVFTHVRLHIYPDGGIARLRVYGTPFIDWASLENELIDLAAIDLGARVIATNNEHFGLAKNLLMPGRGENMGDGWETRRRREPGNDWCIIELAHPGKLEKITVDTAFFKGNYPDRCSIQAAFVSGGTDDSIITQSMFWPEILPEQKLEMDREHFYQNELTDSGAVTHVKLNIFPDGGVSRLRLWGKPEHGL